MRRARGETGERAATRSLSPLSSRRPTPGYAVGPGRIGRAADSQVGEYVRVRLDAGGTRSGARANRRGAIAWRSGSIPEPTEWDCGTAGGKCRNFSSE